MSGTLVAEAVPGVVSLAQLADVLRRLVEERVSIRDLKTILEAIARAGESVGDTSGLVEHVRQALALQLVHEHVGPSDRLPVMILSPVVEERLRAMVVPDGGDTELALTPVEFEGVVAGIRRAAARLVEQGSRPILLTPPALRRPLRRLVAPASPDIVVLSVRELPERILVEPVAEVSTLDPEERTPSRGPEAEV